MIAFFGKQLAISPVMRSKPGDFSFGYLSIRNLTSLGEKCFTGRDTGREELRDSATSDSFFSRKNFRMWLECFI